MIFGKAAVRILILLPMFVLLAFLFSTTSYILKPSEARPPDFWVHFHDYGVRWIPWGILTPAIILLVRRFPFYKSDWIYSLIVHFALSIAFAFGQLAIAVLLNRAMIALSLIRSPVSSFPMFAADHFNTSLLTYWVLVAAIASIDSHRKYRDREIRAFQLETELAKAHLRSLKTQIEPHFLFNTLHAVSALVYRDQKTADLVLSRLGRLVRSTLEYSEKQEIPVEREVEILKSYVEIMTFRFGDRIRVEIDVAPDAVKAMAPSFLLQPLVENAIRHGILPKTTGGTVLVEVRREDADLVFQVKDDGVGIRSGPDRASEGLGLANVRKRLELLYGDRHKFEIRDDPAGGVEVRVVLPFRETFGPWPAEGEA